MHVVICRFFSKIFFCGRSAGGGLCPPPHTPPTQQEHRPCTRVSARRRGQEERQKKRCRPLWPDYTVAPFRQGHRSGIPPPTGEHILTLPLTALCNCNVHSDPCAELTLLSRSGRADRILTTVQRTVCRPVCDHIVSPPRGRDTIERIGS